MKKIHDPIDVAGSGTRVPARTRPETLPRSETRQIADLATQQIESELCTLAGQIAVATSRFLRLLAEFDTREGWAGAGIRSCAHWLSWRCGLSLRAAQEHLRVAHALARLPRIHESYDEGRLSFSKVRAITRVATPVNEHDLLEEALHAPAAHVERLVRDLRACTRDHDPAEDGLLPRPAPTPHSANGSAGASGGDRGAGGAQSPGRLSWIWDVVTGELVISGRLSADAGARLLAAVTRAQIELDRTFDSDNSGDRDDSYDRDRYDREDRGGGQPRSAERGWHVDPATEPEDVADDDPDGTRNDAEGAEGPCAGSGSGARNDRSSAEGRTRAPANLAKGLIASGSSTPRSSRGGEAQPKCAIRRNPP